MVKEAPREELMQAYRKLTKLHDGIRYEVAMSEFNDALRKDVVICSPAFSAPSLAVVLIFARLRVLPQL